MQIIWSRMARFLVLPVVVVAFSGFSLAATDKTAQEIQSLPNHPDIIGFPARSEYEGVEGIGCGCTHPNTKFSDDCGCCFVWWIPFVQNQLVCNNITYEPGALTMSVTMSIGATTIINGTVDLGDPKPLCSDPLVTLGYEICWKFYDIHFTSDGINICSKIYVKWFFWTIWELNLGCIDLESEHASDWQCETETLDGVTSCTSTCDGIQGRTESIEGQEGALFMEYDHHEGELDGKRRELITVEEKDNTYRVKQCQVGARPTMNFKYAN